MKRRYGLRFDSVLILAGLAVLVGCSTAGGSAKRTSELSPVPASASRYLSPTEALASSSDVPDARPVIACFGDSLTAGSGIEASVAYPADLQRLLDGAGYHYRVINEGVNGDTTKDGLARLERVLMLKPQIVVLEFGGNDGLRGIPVSFAQQNIATMIERLQHGGSKVALAGITLPPQYGVDYIARFDAMYPALAKQFHVPLLPFLLQGVYGIEGDIQQDGVHPTAQGAKQVAVNVEKLIHPLLKK